MDKPCFVVREVREMKHVLIEGYDTGYFRFEEDGESVGIVPLDDACHFHDFGTLCSILDSLPWLSPDHYEIIAIRG